jgi:cytochrome P450
MLLTLLFLFAGSLLFIFGLLQLSIARARQRCKPLSPPEFGWLLGHWPDHNYSKGIKVYNEWTKELGNIFFFRLFTTPCMLLSDIKGIKHILSNEEYFSKGLIYRPYKLWFGKGLTPTEGDEAKGIRKVLAPAFSTVRLQAFIPLFNRATTFLFDTRWKNEKYIKHLPNGAFSVKMFEDVRLLAFDTVGTCSGLKLNSLCDESPEALGAFEAIWDGILAQRLQSSMNPLIRFFSRHITPGGRRFYKAIQLLQELSVQAIQKRKKDIAETHDHEVKDFLYHLMEQTDFDEIRVRDLIINFLFAGSDIVGTMIVWTIMLLSKHPEIQEQLYQELKANCPNKDYVLDTELSKVPLLLACIKESLRLFPPVPMMSRRCEKPFTLPIPGLDGKEEVHLEKGQEIMMNFWHAQKAGSWDRPDEFDPTRFLGLSGLVTNDTEKITQEKDKDKGAFCPFSLGRRNCLGQTFAMTQGCVVVARILLRYKTTVDKSIEPSELTLIFKSAMQPTEPIWFTLQPRESIGA